MTGPQISPAPATASTVSDQNHQPCLGEGGQIAEIPGLYVVTNPASI